MGIMRRKRLLVLVGCIFVATIGFGITLPVLPFYAERVALLSRRGSGAGWASAATIQVGLLTAVYPLFQLLVAPLWGRLADTLGRRRLLLIGITGAAVSYVLFAMADTLAMLYVARGLGGLLSSAIFPAAAAYVADSTTEAKRARGMAWLGAASSLGAVLGPALGGAFARTGWELRATSGALLVSSFAVPFLVAAALALVALLGALAWLPESRRASDALAAIERHPPIAQSTLFGLLTLSLVAQFGLALFETSFALFAKHMWRYGPSEVGAAFMVCGLVMSMAQLGVATSAAARVGPWPQIAMGFGLVGASLALLGSSQSTLRVLAMVGILALGIALVSPNVTTLLTLRAGSRVGAALGSQTTANGIGQAAGATLGGILLAWNMDAPFLLAASLFVGVATSIGGWRWRARRQASPVVVSPPGDREQSPRPHSAAGQ